MHLRRYLIWVDCISMKRVLIVLQLTSIKEQAVLRKIREVAIKEGSVKKLIGMQLQPNFRGEGGSRAIRSVSYRFTSESNARNI